MKKALFFAIVSTLAACSGESLKSDKIDLNSIYQKHKVMYSANMLYLTSEFHTNARWDRMETEKSGDHLELSPPSKILFNGKEMVKENSIFTGAEYKLQQEGLPEELMWEWIDNSGKKYINKVKINPISLPNKIFTPGRYQDLEIAWVGSPVLENETVMVTIEGEVNGKNEKDTKSTSEIGDKFISFGNEMLKKFEGNLTVNISRQGRVPVQEGTTAGGLLQWNYDGGFKTTTRGSLLDLISQ